MISAPITFDTYCFDPQDGLSRHGRPVHLTPKALGVLGTLVAHAGRVVSKDALFAAVWPGVVVSDAALVSCIQELRNALDDDARQPRYVETVHRRGYRWIAKVAFDDHRLPMSAPAGRQVVGRELELQKLHEAWQAAEQGQRRILLVSGPPGIGKSTLLNHFQADIGAEFGLLSGRCFEHHGASEPFQALLDALTRTCQGTATAWLLDAIDRYAPSWLSQLPTVVGVERVADLERRAAGVTHPRMLRELTAALEALAQRKPILLVLEDLHWGDPSTIDWLAAFARGAGPARILVLVSYRTGENLHANAPLKALIGELAPMSQCQRMKLDGLTEPSVATYLEHRFGIAAERGRRLAHALYQRTEGQPLFILSIVDELIERGAFAKVQDRWTVSDEAEALALAMPRDLRPLIDAQLDSLDADERGAVDVASVIGVDFAAAAVAAGIQKDIEPIERVLDRLAREERLIQASEVVTWPDGTVSAGYRFRHGLFQDAAYERLTIGQKARLHLLIGKRLEAGYVDQTKLIAGELARHFEIGGALAKAVAWLGQYGEIAARRGASQEALAHFSHALNLLDRLPSTPERDQSEITLRLGLGGQLMATHGWAAPEAEAAFLRARELCRSLDRSLRIFPALWGLWLFYWGLGSLDTAVELTGSMRSLAKASGGSDRELQCHHALWATAFSQGNLAEAEAQAQTGMALYDADQHAGLTSIYGNHDAGVCCRLFGARALALRGRGSEAVHMATDGLAMATELNHPFSQALAQVFAAAVHQTLRDPTAASEHATNARHLAEDHGFGLMCAWAEILGGASLVALGDPKSGIVEIRDGIAATRDVGSAQFLPHYLALQADAELRLGRVDQGLETIAEALNLVAATGERFNEAELYRLQGELLAAGGCDWTEVDAAYLHAIDIAQQQGAGLLALRSVVSRARSSVGSTDHAEAKKLVSYWYGQLGDAASIPDLVEARTFLA